MVTDEKTPGAIQKGLRLRPVPTCLQENSTQSGISTDTEMIQEIESFDHHHFQLIPAPA